jgi:ABC-type polysaccharide/polyol phosphate transport system ATPase subunit
MPAQTLDRLVSPTALKFDRVTKVFSDSLIAARKYALQDIMIPRRDRPARLREHEVVVLRDVSFELKDGQTLLVMGMQDSGKSVLADLVTGKRSPDTGSIYRSGSVGVIGPGKFGQHPLMTVKEYVRLMLALHGVRAAILNQVRDEVIEWAGLTARRDTIVYDLPRSIVTPLAMIGSLLTEHDIYVFDNFKPFGETDLERRLAERFEQIQSRRACVVMARGPNVPARVDHVLILHDGEIIFSGDPDTGLTVYDQFGERIRTRKKQRGAHAKMPTVDEAVTLVTSLLGSGGPLVAIERTLTQLASLERPFIAGPYLSDSGWEVLCWLPFVRWVRRQVGTPPNAIGLTHGDVSAWYTGVTDSFVDIYNLVSPADYERRNTERIEETSSKKQLAISTFERDLMEMVASVGGFADPKALHPSLVLALSAKVARGGLGVKEIADRAVYAPLTVTDPGLGLPNDYIVVALNFVKRFPDSHVNRLLVADVVREASRLAPVVVLGELEWLWSDKHLSDDGNVQHGLRSAAIEPRHARQKEAAVIGRARAVVGNVNGPVTFAPFCGVPGLCLYPSLDGKIDVTASLMAVAAERLDHVPLLTAPIGSLKSADIGRWLEQAIEGRLAGTAQGGATAAT